MSDFRWQIEEVTEEPLPIQNGGEVGLKDVKVAEVKGWEINTPNADEELASVEGGEIGRLEASSAGANKASTHRVIGPETFGVSREFYQNVILALLVVFCLIVVILILNDVWLGQLSFQTFMIALASFLAGRGLGSNRKRGKHDDTG